MKKTSKPTKFKRLTKQQSKKVRGGIILTDGTNGQNIVIEDIVVG